MGARGERNGKGRDAEAVGGSKRGPEEVEVERLEKIRVLGKQDSPRWAEKGDI
jgi:hypothetical protein